MASVIGAIALILILIQGSGLAILLSRLLKGAIRQPPLQPSHPQPQDLAQVTVVVPTLNEAQRIDPCLAGLTRQSYELRAVIVVDSHSHDGTPDRVKAIAKSDPRFRVVNDDPLPSHWVGRPWALHTGYLASSEQSEWILGVDADTQPQPGLIASLLQTAKAGDWDLLSLSPQFILHYPGEWWLQPALLMTLLYRFEVAGVKAQVPQQVMANGQCFFCRRSVLAELGGYQAAAQSFCDDVTLARYAAQQGYKVGFLDGAQVLRVRMYEGAAETWREWGRSLDLKDACTPSQLWGDLAILSVTLGLPLVALLGLGLAFERGADFLTVQIAIALNLFLLILRFALLFAIHPSYYRPRESYPACWLFWLSPLADPIAVLRIFLSAGRTPKQWRGRVYSAKS
jgi:dolichol-phosphate mannosyltransferase